MGEQVIGQTAKRPFYKRTEWWLLVASLVFGGLLGSGILGGGKSAMLAAMIVEALASLGYTIGRTVAKSAEGSTAPGYRSSEFWTSLAAGGLMAFQATDVIPQGSPFEAMLAAALAASPIGGYAVARGKVKAEALVLALALFASSCTVATMPRHPMLVRGAVVTPWTDAQCAKAQTKKNWLTGATAGLAVFGGLGGIAAIAPEDTRTWKLAAGITSGVLAIGAAVLAPFTVSAVKDYADHCVE